MKTILLAIILLLGLIPRAMAQVAVSTPFDYNGVTAVDSSADSYTTGTWTTGAPGNSGGYIYPYPDGNFGYAQQFTINTLTSISALDTSVLVPSNIISLENGSFGGLTSASTAITWNIYSGTTKEELNGNFPPNSPVPLLSSLVAQTSPELLTAYYNTAPELVKDELTLDTTLQPGTYWIAAEYDTNVPNGGNALVEDLQSSYIDPPNGVAPIPEPPTIWLFLVAGGFIIGSFFRQTPVVNKAGT